MKTKAKSKMAILKKILMIRLFGRLKIMRIYAMLTKPPDFPNVLIPLKCDEKRNIAVDAEGKI